MGIEHSRWGDEIGGRAGVNKAINPNILLYTQSWAHSEYKNLFTEKMGSGGIFRQKCAKQVYDLFKNYSGSLQAVL